MGLPLNNTTGNYTYKDYKNWSEHERWELINGFVYDMSPAPSRKHQSVVGELFYQIHNYLRGKQCKAYVAPFDVRLKIQNENEDDIKNIVQPDITIVCDESKLDDKGCNGSPTIVIEVISPFTAHKDMKEKFLLYELVGIKEYWIVHPEDKTVLVFKLNSTGEYGKPEMYSEEDSITVSNLGELIIDLSKVFIV